MSSFCLSLEQDKQQTPSKRAWEGIRKTHSPPSWVRKELEPLQASPLELQAVEWEKTSATIPLVGQEIMDLQTEVWAVYSSTQMFRKKLHWQGKERDIQEEWHVKERWNRAILLVYNLFYFDAGMAIILLGNKVAWTCLVLLRLLRPGECSVGVFLGKREKKFRWWGGGSWMCGLQFLTFFANTHLFLTILDKGYLDY